VCVCVCVCVCLTGAVAGEILSSAGRDSDTARTGALSGAEDSTT